MKQSSSASNVKKASVDTTDIRHRANRKSLVHPLAFLASDFRERIRAGLRQRDHALQPAHAKVMVHLDLGGTRLTDLAARAGVSKQAMGKLVDELEKLGYVCRESHSDGRAKAIHFTSEGSKLLKDSGAIVDDVWHEYAALFGEKRLQRLRDELHEFYDTVREARKSHG